MVGHNDARLGVIIMNEFAADAAGRNHRDLAALAGFWMAHSHNGFDAVIAVFGNRATDRDRLGADCDPADIGVDVHAGDDAAVAGAHRGTHFLPVVAITLADG